MSEQSELYSDMEQVRGIEPPCSAWEADILPLNYTCKFLCIIPCLPALFNPVVFHNFITNNLCKFYNSLLAFFLEPPYTKDKLRKGGVAAIMKHNSIAAQDIDELIFGTSETVIVSDR